MTLPSTSLSLHQTGLLRIEIVAIMMLFVALAIILITRTPPAQQPGFEQVNESVLNPSGTSTASAGILVTPQPQPVSVLESEVP